MQTMFPTSYLAAALVCAYQDIRHYLNGVFVEALETETRLIGTDGATAAVCRIACENESRFSVIIPRDIVELAIKMKSTVLSLEKNDGGEWRIGGIPFRPEDARLPDYRRIIPQNVTGLSGNFDPELLARFSKIRKVLKLKGFPIVRQNGNNPALVHFYEFDDFVGIVAPMRMFTEKMPDLGIPSWAGN